MRNAIMVGSLFVALALAATARAASITVYDTLNTSALAGYGELDSNHPIFGDALTLSQGGTLLTLGFSIYNNSTAGAIVAGTMHLVIYDNTIPYGGGTLTNPILGSADFSLNFGPTGLPSGNFTALVGDLSSLDITLPQNILITQEFTQSAGSATRNGIVLFQDPVIGSSPANVYINSAATVESLYAFSGNPGQLGYFVSVAAPAVVPLPSALPTGGLALGGLLLAAAARRKRAAR